MEHHMSENVIPVKGLWGDGLVVNISSQPDDKNTQYLT